MMECTSVPPRDATNRPPLQDQVDQLSEQVKAMREALSCVMASMLPAFKALEHLEEAARHMHKFDTEDGG